MHRIVSITFKPPSAAQWRVHGAVRGEGARLWNRLVRLHAHVRRRRWKWPHKAQLERWAKTKFPGLHSQSIQQIIADFLDCIEATRKARLTNPNARYPWRSRFHYRDVAFTNQAIRFKKGFAILPCGRIGDKRAYLRVPVPEGILPGRIMETQLGFCELRFVCKVADEAITDEIQVVAADPGVNTLLAATDGQKAVLVNGRYVKSVIRQRNKALAEICSLQAKRTKGSKRWKRLQRAKKRMLAKTRRRIRDAAHKATRAIANAFPNSKIIIGKAFNEASQKLRARNAQTVSQAVNGLIRRQLEYKAPGGCETIEEHYTSQTCPTCLNRKKQSGRIYRCGACGYHGPRDLVGAVNIRTKALNGQISAYARSDLDNIEIKYVRPVRLQRRKIRSSSGGCPASCSTRPLHKAA